jgi:hypothetical protein
MLKICLQHFSCSLVTVTAVSPLSLKIKNMWLLHSCKSIRIQCHHTRFKWRELVSVLAQNVWLQTASHSLAYPIYL